MEKESIFHSTSDDLSQHTNIPQHSGWETLNEGAIIVRIPAGIDRSPLKPHPTRQPTCCLRREPLLTWCTQMLHLSQNTMSLPSSLSGERHTSQMTSSSYSIPRPSTVSMAWLMLSWQCLSRASMVRSIVSSSIGSSPWRGKNKKQPWSDCWFVPNIRCFLPALRPDVSLVTLLSSKKQTVDLEELHPHGGPLPILSSSLLSVFSQ